MQETNESFWLVGASYQKEMSTMNKEQKLLLFLWSLIAFMTALSFVHASGENDLVLQTLEYLILATGVAYVLHLCDEDVKEIVERIAPKK